MKTSKFGICAFIVKYVFDFFEASNDVNSYVPLDLEGTVTIQFMTFNHLLSCDNRLVMAGLKTSTTNLSFECFLFVDSFILGAGKSECYSQCSLMQLSG